MTMEKLNPTLTPGTFLALARYHQLAGYRPDSDPQSHCKWPPDLLLSPHNFVHKNKRILKLCVYEGWGKIPPLYYCFNLGTF